MNAERLLAHYDRIANAPNAIARLRRFVLDLAVRGKLVSQGCKDEPASELLKTIAAKKSLMIKAGELKKEKPLLPITEGIPFDIPPTWQWTRLGTITSYIQRGKSPTYATSDGSPVVSQKCVQWLGLDLTVAKQVTFESLAGYEDIRFLRDGDLLWNSTGTGTIGRIIRLTAPPEKLVCDSHVTVVRCIEVDPEYVRTWLRSDHVYALIEGRAAGSTNQVELTSHMAVTQVVPLPPLAEQHRIVAKVYELMALCDQLEAAQMARESARDRLAVASFARLNDSNPETFQSDANFALEAIQALTTRADQIKQLRQTIRSLAMRGKLVPQDLKDEPASELLVLIELKKAQLIKEGKIREVLPTAEMQNNKSSLQLPSSWMPVTVSDIAYLRSGVALSHDEEVATGDLPYVKVADLSLAENSSGITTSSRFVGKSRWSDAIEAGSIVFPKRGGAIATNRKRLSRVDIVCDSNIMAMKPFLSAITPFVELWFSTFDLWALNSGTSVPQINNKDIYPLALPLPPLAEQHRIVAKVDKLMALCDQLEASLETASATRSRLLEALIAEALAPAEDLIVRAA